MGLNFFLNKIQNTDRTSQETHLLYKDPPTDVFRRTVAVDCETHMKHTDTLCGQNAEFNMVKQVVRIGLEQLGFMGLRR
jgi:hypothetical protein